MRLKVGPLNFKVRYKDLGVKTYGYTVLLYSRIVINSRPSACQRRETQMHEMLHAVWHVAGLDVEMGGTQEEDIIRRISPVLLAALRDNPEYTEVMLGTD